jgi:hypothetical protein
MSKGDSTKAQIIIRTYVMERFLERLSLSTHRSNLILDEIASSSEMAALWKKYQLKYDYAADIAWDVVLVSVRRLCTYHR